MRISPLAQSMLIGRLAAPQSTPAYTDARPRCLFWECYLWQARSRDRYWRFNGVTVCNVKPEM